MGCCKSLGKPILPAMLLLCFVSTGLNADEPRQLTSDGTLKFAPVFTAGGREIVFATHAVPKQVALKRLKLSDGSQELVHPSLSDHQFDPEFSSDGRYHCFVMSAKSPQLVLVIQDKKTNKQYTFQPPGARSTVRTPRMMPDNSRVVFTLSSPGGQQIASVNMQGQDLKKLTQSAGTNCWPAVSPDGKQIAFSSSREGSFDLYVMNADGSGVRRLTGSRFRDVRPAWSPDGKRIAFASARDGNYEIYMIDADGANLIRLTNHAERDDYPTWHPNGRQLLVVAERAGRHDLYLIDAPKRN